LVQKAKAKDKVLVKKPFKFEIPPGYDPKPVRRVFYSYFKQEEVYEDYKAIKTTPFDTARVARAFATAHVKLYGNEIEKWKNTLDAAAIKYSGGPVYNKQKSPFEDDCMHPSPLKLTPQNLNKRKVETEEEVIKKSKNEDSFLTGNDEEEEYQLTISIAKENMLLDDDE